MSDRPYAETSRFIHRMLRTAHHARERGQDTQPYLDNVNALWCGRGTYVFFDDEGRLCCNTVNPQGFSVSSRFYFNRIVHIHPDGRHEVVKDVSLEDSR